MPSADTKRKKNEKKNAANNAAASNRNIPGYNPIQTSSSSSNQGSQLSGRGVAVTPSGLPPTPTGSVSQSLATQLKLPSGTTGYGKRNDSSASEPAGVIAPARFQNSSTASVYSGTAAVTTGFQTTQSPAQQTQDPSQQKGKQAASGNADQHDTADTTQSAHISLTSDHRTRPTEARQLNTNHFPISINAQVLYQYSLDIKQLPKPPCERSGAAGKQREVDNSSNTTDGDNKEKKISARIKRRVILLLLKDIRSQHPDISFASNFKTDLVTSASISNILVQQPITVDYYDEDEVRPRAECNKFDITFGEERVVPVDRILQYLRGDGPPFAGFADVGAARSALGQVESALNIIISQKPNELMERTPNQQRQPGVTFNGDKKFYDVPEHLDFDQSDSMRSNRNPIRDGYAWDLRKPGFLLALSGYFRSTRGLHQASNPLLLNINTTTGCFHYGSRDQMKTVNQLIRDFRSTSQPSWEHTEDFVKGLRVMTTYRRASPALQKKFQDDSIGEVRESIFTIAGLPLTNKKGMSTYWHDQNEPTSGNVSFLDSNEVFTSVHTYFNTTHNAAVDASDFVVRIGSNNFQPASKLRVLPGQSYKAHAEPIIQGSRPPAENWNLITGRGLSMYRLDPLKTQHFGLTHPNSANDALRVGYHKLEWPPFFYRTQGAPTAQSLVTTLKTPSWGLRNQQFAKGADVSGDWSYVELYNPGSGHQSNDMDIWRTVETFDNDHVGKYGLKNANLTYSELDWDHHRIGLDGNLLTGLRAFRNRFSSIKLLLVMIGHTKPGDAAPFYNIVKRWGDIEADLPTICLLKSLGKNGRAQYSTNGAQLGNLMLKFNLKTDERSVNHHLGVEKRSPLLSKGTMLVGIDVTHPNGKYVKPAPSVAAMVASTDEHFNQFPASLRTNPRPEDEAKYRQGQEEVKCLEPMLEERLDAWLRINGDASLPHRIIFFRDGLSVEQFEMCRSRELGQLQRCITKKYGELGCSMPEILLICAVKRHHCRFFRPLDNNNRHDFAKLDNPASGVVIFNGVTYGQNEDFFLVSQDTIKGTTRPTHYVVLHNEITTPMVNSQTGSTRPVTIYDIAEMVYQLCWVYGRCTKTVGLVPPAYYADLACTRARIYMSRVYNPGLRLSRTETYDPTTNPAHRLPLGPRKGSALSHRMYYI
ncbi:hypothetical protein LTR05_001199 [Lithohypha guttulata]|uniref:Piwi domain-containing protein n=1 Tax=Lithohypha guttulata TaxID=1690604 RepID=A0AAN7TDH4_9EURO|nr:hypothetical protein LTR05_001199 [Lithohypha guttulata]